MELWDCHFIQYHVTLDCMGYSMELWCRQMKYHLVPWNSMELLGCHFNQFLVRSTGLPWNIPWNYMELWSGQIKNHQDPSDAMELGGRHFKWHKCSMEFHWTLVPPNEISLSSMEFHGTLVILFNTMLPWISMWYSMEFYKKNHRVPWDSMELGGHHFKWCSMEFHGIFHGVPWNSGTAKWNIT